MEHYLQLKWAESKFSAEKSDTENNVENLRFIATANAP